MTLPRSCAATPYALLRRWLLPALAGLLLPAGLVLAQEAGIEPRAPGDTLREPDSGLVLELSVEPTAGEAAEGGGFRLEFLGAEPLPAPPAEIFTDGFESSGDTP